MIEVSNASKRNTINQTGVTKIETKTLNLQRNSVGVDRMGVTSPNFVNREKELRQVSEAVETLQDEQLLLRTPLFEFSGVQGIGKTTLLEEVKAVCERKGMRHFIKDAEQMTAHDFKQVATLVKSEPVTMILDSMDTANSEQLEIIEAELSELIESTRLFVILASRDVKKFRTRSLARKLTIFPLEPLKHENCLEYLDNFDQPIPPNTRDIILDWTQGYPLAMKVLTDAILKERLDLTKEEERRQLLNILMEEVIEKRLLARASSDERTRLQTLLALFSVPRRFNLTLAENLIDKFDSRYKLENSLAYITLPKAINDVTSVLYWSLERAGYYIEAPIRNLFLLQYRIEDPQRLAEIHTFLAEQNEKFAQTVTGLDRIRYLREYLYHFAFSEEEAKVREALAKQIVPLIQAQTQEERDSLHTYESLIQFYEEFRLDEELKEALGPKNTGFALYLMYMNFLEIYRQFPEKARGDRLKEFFSLITQRPGSDEFDLIFDAGMRQIIKEVSREDAIKLYSELIRDEELKGLLGKKFDGVSERILAELVDEG